jgi:hypothetical protein
MKLQKVISRKTSFLVAILKVTAEIAGSGSRSVSQSRGTDPDPYQYVTDLQHYFPDQTRRRMSHPACWAWLRLLERSLDEDEGSPATTGGCILSSGALLPLGRSESQKKSSWHTGMVTVHTVLRENN